MAGSHWPQTKICSLYQRFSFYIIWKKQYDWQHLVLATHRSFCPTKLCDFSSEWILGNHIISFSPFLCAKILEHVHKSSWTTQYKIFLKRINVMFTIEFACWSEHGRILVPISCFLSRHPLVFCDFMCFNNEKHFKSFVLRSFVRSFLWFTLFAPCLAVSNSETSA